MIQIHFLVLLNLFGYFNCFLSLDLARLFIFFLKYWLRLDLCSHNHPKKSSLIAKHQTFLAQRSYMKR